MARLPDGAGRGAGDARAGVFGSYVDGWRRVWRAPAITVGVLLITWFVTPVILSALGGSFFGIMLAEVSAGQNLTQSWVPEIFNNARGFAFTYEFLTFAGLLTLAGGIADGSSLSLPMFGALATYAGVWAFLSGGILDRLARDRPVRTTAFFATCGGFVLRMLRLAVLAGAGHWLLFRWVNPLLRNEPGEPGSMFGNAAMAGISVVAMATAALIADFAKVRTVVEDRRSAIGALAASIRFVGRRAGRVFALWLLHLAVVAVIARGWYYLASYPSARDWPDLLVVQLYVLLIVWAKLALLGAQISFFQSELAHAGYTAAPLPIWPDSPSAEAIDNFLQRRDMLPPS